MRFALVLALTAVSGWTGPMVVAEGGPAGEWSPWLSAHGDSGIRWRWRANTYGPDVSPDCDFEFRNQGGGQASFRYTVSYRTRSHSAADESGVQYGVTLDYGGGDNVTDCTVVSSISVSTVRRRR